MIMCETGGSTIIILAIILALYLGLKIHLILRANNAPRPLNRHDMENLPRPLINNHMGNLSTFRTFVRKCMLLIENTFVLPFVPADLPSYVTWIFMWYFAITIPMAVTRYYERKWAHDTITIQGPLNLISYYVFGCKTLNLTAVVYTENLESSSRFFPPPPKSDKREENQGRIDWFFSFHLAVGVTWLIVGFVQIYKAKDNGWSLNRDTNWWAHKKFGWFAMFVVCAHICMMAAMTYENPVNQHFIILFGYVGMIFRAISNLLRGFYNAWMAVRSNNQEEKASFMKKHKMHMFFVYARTTMGSGTIRLAAWALWFVGHFLSPEIRLLLDRGACQTYAKQGTGDATDCWRPVYVNMLFTDLIVIWLEHLFLVMPNNIDAAAERDKKRAAFEQQIIIIIPSILLVLADLHIERWLDSSSLHSVIVLVGKFLAEFSAFIWYLIVHWSDDIRDWLLEPEHPIDLQNRHPIYRACMNAYASAKLF